MGSHNRDINEGVARTRLGWQAMGHVAGRQSKASIGGLDELRICPAIVPEGYNKYKGLSHYLGAWVGIKKPLLIHTLTHTIRVSRGSKGQRMSLYRMQYCCKFRVSLGNAVPSSRKNPAPFYIR